MAEERRGYQKRRLERLVKEVEEAQAAGDAPRLDEALEELVDCLFDLE